MLFESITARRSLQRLFVVAALLSISTLANALNLGGLLGFGHSEDETLLLPTEVTFTYTAGEQIIPDKLTAEGIDLKPAINEDGITSYRLYWADITGNKIPSLPLLGGIINLPLLGDTPFIAELATSGQALSYRFPSNTIVPLTAFSVMACSRSADGEYCGESASDKVLYRFRDTGMAATLTELPLITSDLSALSNCSGLEVAATCGNQMCDLLETAETCPADCSDWQLASYNYQTLCDDIQSVHMPSSVAEVQQLVSDAAAAGKRIKVTGQAHSATEVMCTDGVLISTANLTMHNNSLGIQLETFEGVEVVKVPAGTLMWDLSEWLHPRGKSIGYTHLGYAFPTVAGHIATSSHGSSPRHRTVLAHSVVGMEVVTANGQVRQFSRGSTGENLWKALTTNLGYLGVVTSLRIEVQPTSNLHVKVTYHDDDYLFQDGPDSAWENIKGCDFGQYNWYPGMSKVVRTCGMETDAPAEAGAQNRLLNPEVPSQIFPFFKLAMHAAACNPGGYLDGFMERFRYLQFVNQPPFVKEQNGKTVFSADVVGPQHRMITSPLVDGQDGFFQMDWEVAVPRKNAAAAMQYINNFLHGQNAKNLDVRLPLVGVFTRYAKSEDHTLMAYTGTGGPFDDNSHVVHIEMPIYVPAGFSQAETEAYMAPFVEYVTVLIRDFGARAHWAKNREWAFALQRQLGSFEYGNRLNKFNKAITKLDPNGVFANEYGKRIGVEYPNFTYPAGW